MKPCLLWKGARSSGGYGRRCVKVDGKWIVRDVHRMACEAAHGPPPFPGAVAMHSCDTPGCYEPTHLSWGTQADNLHDAARKGRRRFARGEAASSAKLTAADVAHIKRGIAAGRTQQSLANEFGVTQPNISAIKSGKSWAHIRIAI